MTDIDCMDDITVLMSAYNGEKFIREQLDSIRNQDNVRVRLLVRDDGSSDTTGRILTEYMAEFPDFQMTLVRGDNMGYVKSFTELVKIALVRYPNCSYFAFSDHDDVWMRDKLQTATITLNKLNARTENIPIMYCSNTRLVDADLTPVGLFRNNPPEISKSKCLIQNIVTGCTAVFNRKAACLFAERQIPDIAVHDQFLYIICTLLGKTVYDHEPHILYRLHGDNQVGKPNVFKKLKQSAAKLTKDTHSLEKRAKDILSAFDDLLSEKDREIVSVLANYRNSLGARFKLMFDSRFRYTSLLSNVIFKIKIITGRV